MHARIVLESLDGVPRDGVAAPAAHVLASWRRCLERYGLEPHRVRLPHVLTSAELACVRAPIDDLAALASPEIERLFLRLRGHGFIVSLAERGGATVLFRGDMPLHDAFDRTRNVLGAVSSEERQGTNGIGTCLHEARPLIIDGGAHFDARVTGFTCVAAPIFGAGREAIAVLNVSCWRRRPDVAPEFVLDIVAQSARRIGNRFFARRHAGRRVLRISRFSDFADISAEGRLALDGEDRIVDATAEALHLVGPGGGGPIGKRAGDLPAWDCGEGEIPPSVPGQFPLFIRPLDRPGPARRPAPHRASADASPELLDLQGLDPVLEAGIARARRVLGRGLPILLLGETGCGKSALARALHLAGADRGGPFVAVNCAAIPEELIESELFGHRPGAFTGASRKGAPGRLAEAAGGTLFLDEIGDMPLALQTRLLHVLSEGVFVALGGGPPQALRCAVIAASLHDLAALVRSGRFRQDLYFRLAGLVVEMPPLRDRADRDSAIERVFRDEACRAGQPGLRVDAAVWRVLRDHAWPWNFRELRHAARPAAALAEGPMITLAHLPAHLVPSGAGPDPARRGRQREIIAAALQRTGWNVLRAAAQLRISRATLHRRIRRFGLVRPRSGTKAASSSAQDNPEQEYALP